METERSRSQLADILSMPKEVKELTRELHRLNNNLEKLISFMGAVEDVRNMIAPLLGYRVVEKKE